MYVVLSRDEVVVARVADNRDASDRPRSKSSGRMRFPVLVCEIVLRCSTLELRKSGCAD